MATTVYKQLEVELDDGSTVTLKPARIKVLREFMEIINPKNLAKEAEKEEGDQPSFMDILIRGSVVLLQHQRPEWYKEYKEKETTEQAEEVLDIETVNKIVEICGGVKMGEDENLTTQTALGGTN